MKLAPKDRRGQRLSIPTRVFLGFAVALVMFAAIVVYSLVQHERTASTLRLLQDGYLPLALSVGEVKGTQSGMSMVLDRVLDESSAGRNWLTLARGFRSARLKRAEAVAEQMRGMDTNPADARAVGEISADLEDVRSALGASDEKISALVEALANRNLTAAARSLAEAKTREQRVDRRLRKAWNDIQAQIALTSRAAAEQEGQSALTLLWMTGLALVVGLGVMWWTQRLLSPLPHLQRRVAAVARGDLQSLSKGESESNELAQLAGEFERMVEALTQRDAKLRQAERLATVGRMAAVVAHEIRNPLSSVGLNVELLEEELPESNTEARALLKAVGREVDRMTEITEEYLRLARLPEPRLEEEDLAEITKSVTDFVRSEFAAQGVELVVNIAPNLPSVAVDEGQVRQALLNLLRNAREAMPRGGAVHVSLAARDSGVAIRVQDQGSGIDKETQSHIFELFFTTKERGTGLGLPLTQQIVTAHGGTIRCESEEGRGTAFEMWFPRTSVGAGSGATK